MSDECSSIIEFIKQVGIKDEMLGFAEHLIDFHPIKFNKMQANLLIL